jgi:hypothetical protein
VFFFVGHRFEDIYLKNKKNNQVLKIKVFRFDERAISVKAFLH